MVLMVGGMLAVIAMVALIVDGGNAWAQQRVVQNGSDAAAEAGAIVMAQRFAGVTGPAGGWDAEVLSKITANAAANGLTVSAAYYTDICGIPLQADGSKALNLDGTENLALAVVVGSGSLPGGSATTPDCPSLVVGPAAGVLVIGRKDVQTYFAAAIGMSTLGVVNRATAVAGYLQGYCDATQGQTCAILPIAVPVSVVTCDPHGNTPILEDHPWVLGQVYKVPLCNGDPGNVGWLDWTPPGGGTPDTVCSILHPDNPAIDLPSWQYVAAAGNTNGGGGPCHMSIEEALRTYDGQVVMIPQFDATCNPAHNGTPDSTEPAINNPDPPDYLGCGEPLGGSGVNLWYRMPSFAYFELCSPSNADCDSLHGAYIQGSDLDVCDTGGNGATSCLVGRFVEILATGTVGPGVGGGTGGTKAIGVQLIK
jgi:Flp pilus assembly protein TadG